MRRRPDPFRVAASSAAFVPYAVAVESAAVPIVAAVELANAAEIAAEIAAKLNTNPPRCLPFLAQLRSLRFRPLPLHPHPFPFILRGMFRSLYY